MTQREAYESLRGHLGGFEARQLLEHVTGARPLPADDRELDGAARDALMTLAARRRDGEPLQYLLGRWDFLSLTLEVGEGVLIPRPETELLCLLAAEALAGIPDARVLDLCAGSGCVSLGTASLLPGATVTAVELSDAAWPYLERNCRRYPQYAVRTVRADALADGGQFEDGAFDALLSNPPYIPTGELPGLQPEVRREPALALDGGPDGLEFYRAIAARWLGKLAPGGLCAVEIGAGQAGAVTALFSAAGLRDVGARRDYAGLERIVYGWK